MTKGETYELDRKRYVWDGTGWYEEGTYMTPPKALQQKLDAMRRPKAEAEDAAILDFQELLDMAKLYRTSGNPVRAEKLVRRALAARPGHVGALSVLCSILRAEKRPDEAVAETEAVAAKAGYAPLLTCRAAALCDLERWDEAYGLYERLRAMGASGAGAEVVAILRSRIRKARPDLIEDEDDA